MANCSQLPIWVSFLPALFVPVVAAVGAWIAAKQMLIAHDKVRRDAFDKLYDRRVAVFEATRKILADVFQGNISESDVKAYGLAILGAQFLFDNDMCKFLEEIHLRIAAWRDADSASGRETGAERAQFISIRNSQLNWIAEQGDERFTERFRPFLTYQEPMLPRLLRWPDATKGPRGLARWWVIDRLARRQDEGAGPQS
jgi:hypothetical protein